MFGVFKCAVFTFLHFFCGGAQSYGGAVSGAPLYLNSLHPHDHSARVVGKRPWSTKRGSQCQGTLHMLRTWYGLRGGERCPIILIPSFPDLPVDWMRPHAVFFLVLVWGSLLKSHIKPFSEHATWGDKCAPHFKPYQDTCPQLGGCKTYIFLWGSPSNPFQT